MADIGRNVQVTVKGNTMTIVVDLSKDFGLSGSGKNLIVASTGGNQEIEGANGLKLGLNAYRKPPAE